MEPIGTLGERVRRLRKKRGLTQIQLAEQLDIAQGSLSDIETGVTKDLSGKVLAGLCESLTTTPKYLMTGTADLAPTEEDRVLLAELSKLAQEMTTQALTALLDTARTVHKATETKPVEEEDGAGRITVKKYGDRSKADTALTVTRRQQLLREQATRSGSKRAAKKAS